MISEGHRGFRRTVQLFAVAVGLAAAWVIGPELIYRTTTLIAGTQDDVNATGAATAWRAARFATVRGDLWAEAALAYAGSPSLDSSTVIAPKAEALAAARTAADRALGFSPHDSRIWLLLASLDADAAEVSDEVAALKMSFYTGPNEVDLIPLRLALSIGSGRIADDDLQQLVYSQIRTIVTRQPSLIPAIEAAYRKASPNGRQYIERTLGELDPGLLASIRANASHP